MLILNGPSAHSLVFSRDGMKLVVGCQTGEVQVWEPPYPLFSHASHTGRVSALAFTKDESRLATGGLDGLFHLWRMDASGTLARVGGGPRNPQGVTGLAFVQRDRHLAVGLGDPTQPITSPRTLFLWDAAGSKAQSIALDRGHLTYGVRALTSLPEHRLVAWANDHGALVVWDMTRPDAARINLKSAGRCIALSPDGKLLAAATERKIVLFDIRSRSELMTIASHKGVVAAVDFSPDGRILMSGSWDSTVKWWDPGTGRELQSFSWPVGRISKAVFAPDGMRAAAAGDEGKIVVWDVDY